MIIKVQVFPIFIDHGAEKCMFMISIKKCLSAHTCTEIEDCLLRIINQLLVSYLLIKSQPLIFYSTNNDNKLNTFLASRC